MGRGEPRTDLEAIRAGTPAGLWVVRGSGCGPKKAALVIFPESRGRVVTMVSGDHCFSATGRGSGRGAGGLGGRLCLRASAAFRPASIIALAISEGSVPAGP